jgi:excinuclease ABC subunit A
MSEPASIHLRGVRVHNLKGVDLDLPLRRLTAVTGVSGAGKSSLAFDTLYAESQRRYLQSFSAYTRQFLERLDKPDADFIDQLPPAIAVAQRGTARGARATVGTLTELVDYLRLLLARAGELVCLRCGLPVLAATTADVVAAAQALPAGTRFSVGFPSKPADDAAAWAAALREEGFVRLLIDGTVVRLGDDPLPDVGDQHKVFVLVDRLEAGRAPLQRLTDSVETAFARGQGRMALLTDQAELPFDQRLVCPRCDILYPPPDPRLLSFNDPLGACPVCSGTGALAKRGRTADEVCPECKGTRLNENARTIRLGGRSIVELSAMSIGELAAFCEHTPLPERHQAAARVLLTQIQARLGSLREIELGYLTLDRRADTLSAGEGQRVRLTASLSAQLVNALYVLDEPTVGLHPRDTDKLLAVLLRLRDAGNTVVVVEHDADVIRAADHVVDLGPGAGEEGGTVVFQGTPGNLRFCEESVTAAYLTGRRAISVPARRRPLNHGHLRLVGARANNLHDLTVDFPLGVLCAVTGVSGAGKSSLVEDELYPALLRRKQKAGAEAAGAAADVIGAGQINDVVLMDQTPLARTARSNAATYVKVFDDIRQLFAETSEARVRNLSAAAFSFNQPGGRCDACEGQGTLTVDMQFLADVTVTCPECHGRRYKRDVLNVKVRSLDIAEVLDLTVRAAFRFFRAQQGIERRLKLLLDVGLDYLRLGQPADTLSGGECQRLKLAGHLAASRKPRCLFLLDEPTAGLHPADVSRLLDCCDRLLQTGHSLIVVEHDLDVIKCADHVIDLGPGAGADGGRVVAEGTPEELTRVDESHTGVALRGVVG